MLNSVVGEREGQLYFTADGGGDITAYAWNASSVVWTTVGLYSYRRQQIEGALGVRQLKGQKIGGAVPRNQIEHFYALARQFEDENQLAALSPTTADSGSSRMRQQSLANTIPTVVSPRPQRPSATFKIESDFTGSLSTVDCGSQQTGFPTLNTLAGTSSATATLQRGIPKVGTDYASATNLPPFSVLSHESRNPSPTFTRNQSPTSLRHQNPSTAATSFDQHGANGDSASNLRPAHYNSAAMINQQLQYKIWHEEQMRKQERSRVEASRDPIYGDAQLQTLPRYEPHSTNGVPRSSTGYAYGSVFKAAGAVHDNEQMVDLARRDTPVAVPFDFSSPRRHDTSEVTFNKSFDPWSSATKSKATISPIESPNRNPPAGRAPVPIQRPARSAEEPIEYRSIMEIGDSVPDTTYEPQRPIHTAPKKLKGPMVLNGSTDEEQEEDEESLPDMNIRYRGRFFDTVEDDLESLYADFHLAAEEMYSQTLECTSRRTNELRQKARQLRDKNGRPLSSEKVDAMAADPIAHLLAAVNANMSAYKSTDCEKGDYWQKQWSKPGPELTDMAASKRGEKRNSYFGAAEPSSDEVLFKGRSNSRPTSVPSTVFPKPVGVQTMTGAGPTGYDQMSSQASATPSGYGGGSMGSQGSFRPIMASHSRVGRPAASRRSDFDVAKFQKQGFGGHGKW